MQLDLQVPGLGWDLGSVFLTGFLGNAHTHMVRGPRGHVVKMSVGVLELEHQALPPVTVSSRLHWLRSTLWTTSGVWCLSGPGAKQMLTEPAPPFLPSTDLPRSGPHRPAELHGDSGPGAPPLPTAPEALELPGGETGQLQPLGQLWPRACPARLPAAGTAPTSAH